MNELYDLVRRIPPGMVASYGDLGRVLDRPVSGVIVGRWMARDVRDVPWWRVVAKDGTLPVWKRDASLEDEQVQRLLDEGVQLEGGRVPRRYFVDPDSLTH